MRTSLLLLLTACTVDELDGPGDAQGVQIGEEDPFACPVTYVDPDPADAEALLALVDATVRTDALDLTLHPSGPAMLAMEQPADGFPAIACSGERVEVPVAVQVDGSGFAVSGTTTAWATRPGRAAWTLRTALAQVQGPLAPTTFDPADHDAVELVVDATRDEADGWSGFVQWQALGGDGDRGESVVSFAEE
jgi:hypothetical protein